MTPVLASRPVSSSTMLTTKRRLPLKRMSLYMAAARRARRQGNQGDMSALALFAHHVCACARTPITWLENIQDVSGERQIARAAQRKYWQRERALFLPVVRPLGAERREPLHDWVHRVELLVQRRHADHCAADGPWARERGGGARKRAHSPCAAHSREQGERQRSRGPRPAALCPHEAAEHPGEAKLLCRLAFSVLQHSDDSSPVAVCAFCTRWEYRDTVNPKAAL